MKYVFFSLFIVACVIPAKAQVYKCLAPEVRIDDIVKYKTVAAKNGGTAVENITIEQTLKNVGARCSHGKLVDGRRRQIRFYTLQGCWGNPPADYLEILDKQAKEIAVLKKKFRVIEIECNRMSAL